MSYGANPKAGGPEAMMKPEQVTIAANKAITITTSAIALENGQIGDMISVKNVNSEKIFKVIVTGKKKVAPITNM